MVLKKCIFIKSKTLRWGLNLRAAGKHMVIDDVEFELWLHPDLMDDILDGLKIGY